MQVPAKSAMVASLGLSCAQNILPLPCAFGCEDDGADRLVHYMNCLAAAESIRDVTGITWAADAQGPLLKDKFLLVEGDCDKGLLTAVVHDILSIRVDHTAVWAAPWTHEGT